MKPVLKLVPTDDPVSNRQRALWSFLLITLVAPFVAALVIFLASVMSGAIGRGPPSLLALDRAGQLAWAAEKAVAAYVWSAIPAGIGGAVIAVLVAMRRSVNWLTGAIAGAVVVSVLAAMAGGMFAQHIAPMAFIGAGVGALMCRALAGMGILR